MPNEESRAPLGPIQLRPYDCSDIPNRELQCARSCPLGLARDIVRRPAQDDRDRGIDTSRCQNRPRIGQAWPVTGDEENVPNDGEGGTGDDEYRPSLCLLRDYGDTHSHDESKRIWWGREQLCLGGSVTQIFDDCREEETESIDR